MARAQCPLEIDVGLPLRQRMQLMADAATPADLTGAEFEAHCRPSSGAAPLVSFTVTIEDATAGKILISATAEQVEQIADRAAWNLIMTDSLGDKSVILRGPVELAGVIQ